MNISGDDEFVKKSYRVFLKNLLILHLPFKKGTGSLQTCPDGGTGRRAWLRAMFL